MKKPPSAISTLSAASARALRGRRGDAVDLGGDLGGVLGEQRHHRARFEHVAARAS
jgi:hypothetical protein